MKCGCKILKHLKKGLLARETPILVTALFAAVGWGSTHIIDRIVNSPTVKYDVIIEKKEKEGSNVYYKTTVEIHNISLNTSFKNVEFFLRRASNSDVTFFENDKSKAEVIPTPPVWAASDFGPDKLPKPLANVDPRGVAFTVPSLPPNGRVNLVAYFQGTGEPVLQVRSKTAMLLSSPSFKTWLAINEFPIIVTVIIIWALVVMLLLSWGAPASKPQGNSGAEGDAPSH